MNVKIKSFDIEMEVKQKGIEFDVRTPDGKRRYGDCYVTMTCLEWCQGKISKGNGVQVSWDDFMVLMSSKDALKRAIKAAKAQG